MAKYRGGFITSIEPTVTSNTDAKGVWSLVSQLQYKAAGSWPNLSKAIVSTETTQIRTFTSSGSWTAPDDVTSIDYVIVAGGGGGGYCFR